MDYISIFVIPLVCGRCHGGHYHRSWLSTHHVWLLHVWLRLLHELGIWIHVLLGLLYVLDIRINTHHWWVHVWIVHHWLLRHLHLIELSAFVKVGLR